MPTIDADAHVIESEETWKYMEGSEAEFRPKLINAQNGKRTWVIDGKEFPRGGNVNRKIPTEVLEMRDIENRLKHMDELGIDIQVLYTSLFLRPLTSRPEVEVGLFRSYNRWLADVWRKAEDRLRWVAMVPLMSIDKSIEEARFAKDNGGCGLFFRGLPVGNKLLSDPYYYPLYEEAAKLSLPICVHASTGDFNWVDLFEHESGFAKFKLAPLSAFHSILNDGVPSKFPKLRFGFIEIRAQWVPYAIVDIRKRFEQKGKHLGNNALRDNRIFVTCQTDDDLPYVLKYSGEDNIVIGSDYGHQDTSAEIEALRKIKTEGEVSPEAIDKILYANAKELYGL